jgi:D-alanyl-D-alanine carboxypeptidase
MLVLAGTITLVWWQNFREPNGVPLVPPQNNFALSNLSNEEQEGQGEQESEEENERENELENGRENEQQGEQENERETEPELLSAYGVPLVLTPLALLTDTSYLKLVNREFAVNATDYSKIVDAWPTVPVRATDIQIHQTVLGALAALFAEAPAELRAFFVTSGYRNFAHQAQIYENAVDRMYVMPPGHSEHQLGLGVDILATDITMPQMSGTPEALWLAENAWRHGMILRYPYGTTHITDVAYEPWHFRYVGLIHAWYMTRNNLVLEEHLDFLEERQEIIETFDGVTYYIMYKWPTDGYLPVPKDLQFNISASNRGGYIITAWE